MASSAGKSTLTAVRGILKHISNTKGFDRVSQKLEVVAAKPGHVTAQFTVGEEDVNTGGTLHGGYTAYMVDLVSTAALMTTGSCLPGVSVELSVSYMRAARAGELVTVDAAILKTGRQLGFCNVDLRNAAGQLVAQGKHTKYLG